MKTLLLNIKNVSHLKSFNVGDKVRIKEYKTNSKLTGFIGEIKELNITSKHNNKSRGTIVLETKGENQLALDGIVGKLTLEKLYFRKA